MRRFVSGLLCAVSLLCMPVFFAGCGKETAGDGERYTVETLNDFENYRRDFQTLDVINYFGIVDANTDPQYVHGGKMSAKLTCTGGELSDKAPIMRHYLTLAYDGKFTDFSHITKLTAEMYNAGTTDVQLSVQLVFGWTTALNRRDFTLAPGQWTTLEIETDRGLPYAGDITDCTYIDFIFERPKDADDVKTVYLDDILAYYDAEKDSSASITLADPVETEAGTVYELCNFDHFYDEYAVAQHDNDGRMDILPVLSLNDDPAYTDGGTGSSLRVEWPVSPGWTLAYATYPGFKFSLSRLTLSEFGEYSGTDVFSFKVFNAASVPHTLSVSFAEPNMGRFQLFTFEVQPNTWYDFSKTFAEINAKLENGTSIMNSLEIVTPEFTEGESRVLYFDSFRLTRTNKEK